MKKFFEFLGHIAYQTWFLCVEGAFLLLRCPEMIWPIWRLLELSLQANPYRLHKNVPPTRARPEIELTYGEIALWTIDRIFRRLGLDESDHIFDLGSGRGRVVMLAAARGLRATGIEIVPGLCAIAKEAARDYFPHAAFYEDDILRHDLTEATLFWLVGTCFEDDTRAQIAKRICELKPGIKIVSVSEPLKHPRLPIIETQRGLSSWGHTTLYIQQLSAESTPEAASAV